jgi:phosphate transport system substrate-binding protein
MAAELEYVTLPDSVKALVRKTWAESIKDGSGKPVVGELSEPPTFHLSPS